MNPLDQQLNRLFHAARQARPVPVTNPAFGLETRALAAWRKRPGFEPGFWDMALLVRGLILAGLIMAVSFWPVLNKTSNPFNDYLQLADSSIPSDDAP